MNKKNLLLSFLFPILILYTAYAVLGIYPFGTKTLFNGDLQGQYVDFFSYLHEMLQGNVSWTYTFSKVLGGTMIDMMSYYLSSPFNLLFCFFDARQMPLAVFLISSLKIGCISMSMYWLIQHREQSASMVIFAVAYALSGWVISYQFQLMWLDGLILLPILIFFIENFEEKSPVFYTIALALGIITNYYIGYMICGICALYFIVYRVFVVKLKRKFKDEICIWIKFAWYSGIGVLLSAFLLIPTLFALRGGKMGSITLKSLFDLRMRFSLFQLPSQIFPFSFSMDQLQNEGLPLIYCGILSCLCCCGYFLSRKETKEKIGYFLLLLFLALSMTFYGLYQAWHGFAHPAGFQTRFSFIYIFFVVYLGSIFWADDVMRWHINRKKYGNMLKCFVLFLACIECWMNIVDEYKQFSFQEKSEYDLAYENNYALSQIISETQGDDFFRVAGGELNGGWMYQYPSISSYTSCEKVGLRKFTNRVGLYTNGYWSQYSFRNTPELLNSLFGVKYLLLSNDLDANEHYSIISQSGSEGLYDYDTTMPLGFWVKEELLSIDIQEDNPMVLLKSIWDNVEAEKENEIIRELSLENRISFENNQCAITIPNKDHIVLYLESDAEYIIHSDEGYYAEVDRRNPLVLFSDKDSSYEKKYYIDNISEPTIFSAKLYECDLEEAKRRISSQAKNEELVANIHMDSYDTFSIDIQNLTGENQFYLLTIPYERKAWRVSIDNQNVETMAGLDYLMMIKLPEGEYEVNFRYIPRGSREGLIISIVGMILLLASEISSKYLIGKGVWNC